MTASNVNDVIYVLSGCVVKEQDSLRLQVMLYS